MILYKFGGASVNSAAAVRNMAAIVQQEHQRPLIIVVSAMGKSTNRLEQMVPGVRPTEERPMMMEEFRNYHLQIIRDLFPDSLHPVYSAVNNLLDQLNTTIAQSPSTYNRDYDQTVCFGELISTTIIHYFLAEIGLTNQWVDVRKILRTDNRYREGKVDFSQTATLVKEKFDTRNDSLFVTQGFIAGTSDGSSTTLGREGSDYSASILAYCLDATSITIWKDVPGFLNADPKFFPNTVKIEQMPYNEAIELAYYGASVIHPKTVKPIQNKNIKLHIRSFLTPDAPGSVIGPFPTIEPLTPLFIVKNRQTLLSIMPKDFSFIAEDNLQYIFAILSELNIRVNLMQNTALSFSICIDDNEVLLQSLQQRLSMQFLLRYNRDLQLITIRYYTQYVIDKIVAGRPMILQQRSRSTAQIIVPKE